MWFSTQELAAGTQAAAAGYLVALAITPSTANTSTGQITYWIGLALLVNVVAVAMLATPVFEFFGAAQLNTWVTLTRFVWLPTVMVLAAFAGHVIVFRAVVGGQSHGPSQ